MRINTNINAMNAQRNLGIANTQNAKSLERLSSGLRINRAADDAAGLSISEKLRGQIRGLNQASRNAQDGISMIQTAEGALNESHSILQRMNELGLQGANGTLSADDRKAVVAELKALRGEVDRISATTDFNGTKLLKGGTPTTTAAPAAVGAITRSDATSEAATVAGTFTGTADLSYVVRAKTVATGAAASLGSITKGDATSESATVSGTYTGAADANFSVRVKAVDSGTAASLGSVTQSDASSEGATVGGTYTGAADAAYQVRVTSVDAGTPASVGAVTPADATAEEMTVGGSFTGAADTNFKVRVAGISGADDGVTQVVDSIEVSTDGGTTWGAAIAVTANDPVNIGDGLTVSFADLGTTTTVGDEYDFAATAAVADPSGSQIITGAEYTTDGGTTWTAASMSGNVATLNEGITMTFDAAGTSTNMGDTYDFNATAAVADPAGTQIINQAEYSTDGGTTWTDATMSGNVATLSDGVSMTFGADGTTTNVNDTYDFAATAAVADPSTSQIITLAEYSTNGGTSWTDATMAGNVATLNNGLSMTFDSTGTSTNAGDTYSFAATAAATTTTATALTIDLQVGANNTTDEKLDVVINSVSAGGIGAVTGGPASLDAAVAALEATDGATATNFRALVDSVQESVKNISEVRSNLGAAQNRLEHTIANIGVATENLSASESRVRDLDMAAEVVAMTKSQILGQAGTAILAQANQAPQNVMSLLR